MDACCDVRTIPQEQRRVLQLVLAINIAMFLAEAAAGLLAHSTALLADSLDMLGDAVVYGFSLYVIDRGAVWKARAALVKGLVMGAFGLGVLVQAGITVVRGLAPTAEVMGAVAFLALVANLACLALLARRRGDDVNMRSAWVCSRSDVLGNVGVLVAAAAVGLTGSAWPDVVIGVLLAGVFLRAAATVVRDARRAAAGSVVMGGVGGAASAPPDSN